MKRIGLNIIVCFVLSVVPVLPLSAQKLVPMTRAALDSIMNPELLENGENILRFDECIQSVGTILETDAPVTTNYAFRHVGSKPVSIRLVRTFCRCTSARYDTLTLQPGDTGHVALVYRPRNHPGTIDECAYVYTSESDSHPVARLVLLGEVKEVNEWRHLPHAIGSLRLKQTELMAGEWNRSRPIVIRIACANAGPRPLRLSADGLPAYASFHTEPRVLRPGVEGDLVITMRSDEIPAYHPSVFSFRLQGIDASAEERTMLVRLDK